jgi:hypothetical protein
MTGSGKGPDSFPSGILFGVIDGDTDRVVAIVEADSEAEAEGRLDKVRVCLGLGPDRYFGLAEVGRQHFGVPTFLRTFFDTATPSADTRPGQTFH